MNTPTNSVRFARLKVQAEHLADTWPKVISRYRILKAFTTNRELAESLTPSRAANTHNALVDVLTLDLLRELSAIVLDDRKDVMSLRRLLHLLSDANIEAELRREYEVVPPPLRLYDENELTSSQAAEIQERWVERRRADSLREFDRLKSEIKQLPAKVLETDIAERVLTARNRAVAHYGVVADGSDWRSFEIKEAGIRLGALDAYVHACTQAMELVALYVRRAGVDYSDSAAIDDRHAAEYVEALVVGRRVQRRRDRLIRRRLVDSDG